MKIPNSVIYVVGDVLGQWYYSHTKLNTLFGGNGFPGEPPTGNCVQKSQEWLRRANQSKEADPITLLGGVLVEFMSLDRQNDPKWKDGFQRITDVLAKNALTFDLNGIRSAHEDSPPPRALPAQQHDSKPTHFPFAVKPAPMKTVILFLAANPDGVTKLALDQESRAIREKIRSSDYPKSLDLKTEWAVRPDDLLQYLNEYRPHVVHFSGHGSPNEELILHDSNDQPQQVSKAALRALFTTLKDNVRLVVLNACYSRPQAESIIEVIDCAVGMKRAIGDAAAIVFAASFYRALGFGRSVKEAFDQGVAALLLQGIRETDTPELLTKAGVNPSNIRLVDPPENPK
jgi:hypothetical protein